MVSFFYSFFFFFFNDTATTEIYTLSLHDALPIFLSAALGVIPPFLLRDVLDNAIKVGADGVATVDLQLLVWLVAGMIAIPIITQVCMVFTMLLTNLVGQAVMHDLRTSVYRHLQRLSLA